MASVDNIADQPVLLDTDTNANVSRPSANRKRSRSRSIESDRSRASSTIRHCLEELLRSKKTRLAASAETTTNTERVPSYLLKSTELKWKSDLDKRQFEFNEKMLESLNITHSLLSGSRDRATQQAASNVNAAISILVQRQKLIRFADRSTGGWSSAYEYEKDDLADDSDDEKRLRNAESRALRKKKEKSSVNRFSHFASQRGPVGWRPSNFGGPRFSAPHAGPYVPSSRPGPSGSNRGCFKCGNSDHWANKCPLVYGSHGSRSSGR